MTNLPSNTTVDVWIGLWRTQQLAFSYIEDVMKKHKLPSIKWYDVLLELDWADNSGLRPFEIQNRLLFPQYRLSRLLTKLEAENLVERHRCKEDGRGYTFKITKEGRELRRKMWPVYGRAININIGERLSEAEIETLAKLLNKLYK